VGGFEFDEFESVSSSMGVEDKMSDVVERDEQAKDGIRGRWGNLLRRPHGRHEASSTVDDSTPEEAKESPRDRFQRESPYIYTAT
jgi:hypothetical protein